VTEKENISVEKKRESKRLVEGIGYKQVKIA
jgi:hypothetical protein